MNFGYLLVVSKHEDIDYLKLAYALAINIKLTQRQGYDKVALVIDDVSAIKNLESPWVFDEVIEWKQETFWNGRSWMDLLTPWDHTVCLDVDMLFFRDQSHVIDYLIENVELFLPSKVYTYRGELVKDSFYRKTFIENQLPNLYSMFTFFKKDSAIAKEFFTLGRHIIKNPLEFKNYFLQNYVPRVVGTDEALALSAKILGIDNDITWDTDFAKIVHLKAMIQNWPWPADSVSDHVGMYFDNSCNLKIGNFKQYDIVHYNDKEFITEEYLSILENKLWQK
jgi:hypothetical protein